MHSLRHFLRFSVRYTRRISNATTLRQEAAAVATTTVPPLQTPAPDGPNKPLSPKIEQLVSSITNLNLLEVSELSQALKKRLNLPDAPMMAMGAMPAFGAAAPAEEEEAAPKTVKTSFTLKLEKYDEKQKIALIKELKNLMEGMNLVQAKKFVESAPAIIKADIAKDEAEKLKEALTKVGAECSID